MTYSQIESTPHRDVVIVGGGPSLLGWDLSPLCKRCYVLVVNNAVWKLPAAAGFITADMRWAEHYQDRLIAEFAGEKFIVAPEDSALRCLPGISYLRHSTELGLCDRADTVKVRGSSGYAAINAACLLGAKRIWLLGFDMAAPGRHWFGTYPWKSAIDDSIFASWIAEFRTLAASLCAAGVSVTNVGMGSKLDCFPKQDISDYFGWVHETQRKHLNNRDQHNC